MLAPGDLPMNLQTENRESYHDVSQDAFDEEDKKSALNLTRFFLPVSIIGVIAAIGIVILNVLTNKSGQDNSLTTVEDGVLPLELPQEKSSDTIAQTDSMAVKQKTTDSSNTVYPEPAKEDSIVIIESPVSQKSPQQTESPQRVESPQRI